MFGEFPEWKCPRTIQGKCPGGKLSSGENLWGNCLWNVRRGVSEYSLMSHSTHNRSFWRRVFPGNQLEVNEGKWWRHQWLKPASLTDAVIINQWNTKCTSHWNVYIRCAYLLASAYDGGMSSLHVNSLSLSVTTYITSVPQQPVIVLLLLWLLNTVSQLCFPL